MKNIIIEDNEICCLLDEVTEEAKINPRRLDGVKVFAEAKRIANGKKI